MYCIHYTFIFKTRESARLEKRPSLVSHFNAFQAYTTVRKLRKLLLYYFVYMFMWYFLIGGGGGDMRRHVSHSPIHLIRLILLYVAVKIAPSLKVAKWEISISWILVKNADILLKSVYYYWRKEINYLILSYLILSYLILSYLILSYLILSYLRCPTYGTEKPKTIDYEVCALEWEGERVNNSSLFLDTLHYISSFYLEAFRGCESSGKG